MMLSVLSHAPLSSLSGLYRFLPWIVRNISESKVRIVEKWVELALHQKSGSDTRGGRSALNKPPLLVVACNFGAKPVEVLASCAASNGRGQSVRDEENRDYRRRSYQDSVRPKARV